jgi:UDP-N-acetylglucosamine--N-acetylmuramyl-(pentapeptide) pyrophosphoryl-undecaprenol N-acetylglucosamine transferase
MRILRKTRPDVVIGVGGYSSGPVGAAALGRRIPLIIIEPNSYAGFANRELGRYANRIMLCFPGTGAARFFPAARTVTLGPLVRQGIDTGDRDKALVDFGLERSRFTVFAMGGSGGAHAINMAMKEGAALLRNLSRVQVLHQTGEQDTAEVAEAYRTAGVKAAVLPYIHDMAGAYAVADLVIARSGATTIAELAVCGKRAVLIPFPFAADNHQEHNARTLAGLGQAEVIIQKDLTPAVLARAIQRYIDQGAEAGPVTRMDNTAATEIVRLCKDHV